MPETLLVFGTDKQFRTLQHLLYHHACGILNLHHAVEFQGQMLLCADVQGHTAYIALMHWSHHLGYDRITHLIGKGRQFFLRCAHHFWYEGNACARENVTHGLRWHVTIVFDAKDDFVESGDVNTIELYLRGGWFGRTHNLTQGRGQRHLVAEVHMALLQEFGHLRTCGMQTGQDGEDRFLARQHLLVQHLVGFVQLRQSWCTIDDGNGIDVLELLFAIVNGYTQLFGCSRSQNVDRIGYRRARE